MTPNPVLVPPEVAVPDAFELPTLYRGAIDSATYHQLFLDLAECANVLEVRAKAAPGQYASTETLSLNEGQSLLTSGAISGLQITYVFEGQTWRDTLLRQGPKLELVRMLAEFASG